MKLSKTAFPSGLRDSLMHSKRIANFVQKFRRAFNPKAEAAGANAERHKALRDLAQVDKKIAGIMAAIEDGMYQPTIKCRMAELEAEKKRPVFRLDYDENFRGQGKELHCHSRFEGTYVPLGHRAHSFFVAIHELSLR